MKNRKDTLFCIVIVLCLSLTLTSCGLNRPDWSFSLSDGLSAEDLGDRAMAHMVASYGDIFETSELGNYTTGSVE